MYPEPGLLIASIPDRAKCAAAPGESAVRALRRLARSRTWLRAVLVLAAIALCPASAANGQQATDQPDPWAGVEEMQVLGSTTAGLLGDTTTSAIAFDASDLQDIGAQDVSDLARFTPSLEINTTSATTPTFFIRGVGLNDANANAAGAIAIYVDNVPINSAAIQLAGLFDTASVEVLRGPQGYTDARNASGGMINTVSKKPDGEFSSYLRTDFGNFGYNDIEGALGFPVLGEEVSGRISFRRTYRDDLIENRCGNLPVADTGNPPVSCGEGGTLTGGSVPAGLDSETNDVDRWGARAHLKIAADVMPEEMEWLLSAHVARIDQTSPLGQTIGTQPNARGQPGTQVRYVDPDIVSIFNQKRNELRLQGVGGSELGPRARAATLETVTRNIERARPFRNDYDLVGREVLTQVGGFVRGDMAFGDVSIMSVTGIERWDRERDSDFDFSSAQSIIVLREDDATQFSQNIGLETELESLPIRIFGGGFFLTEFLDSNSDFTLRVGSGPAQVNQFIQSYTQDLYSFGLFAGLEWELLEGLTFEAGARINWEQKEFELGLQRIQFGTTLPASDPAGLTRTWSAPTGGFNLSYEFTEDILAYWKYTRGWKSGHINASVLEINGNGSREDTVTATPTVAQPETIDAVEFGIETGFLDNLIKAKASGFVYKYDNYQVFLIESQAGSAPQLEILNANTAQVYGVEADFVIRPLEIFEAPQTIEGLTLSANFAWLESKFLDFSDIRTAFLPSDPASGEINIGSYTVDFTGNRLPNTPQFKVSATLEWAFDIEGFGVITPRYDLTWTDDIFFDPSEGRATPRFGETSSVFPEYSIGQRAYALHDFRLTYAEPNGMVTVSGWVRNATNVVYKQNVLDLTTAFNQINNFVGTPRTWGFSATMKF